MFSTNKVALIPVYIVLHEVVIFTSIYNFVVVLTAMKIGVLQVMTESNEQFPLKRSISDEFCPMQGLVELVRILSDNIGQDLVVHYMAYSCRQMAWPSSVKADINLQQTRIPPIKVVKQVKM